MQSKPDAPGTFWPSGRIVHGIGTLRQLDRLTGEIGEQAAFVVDEHVAPNPAVKRVLESTKRTRLHYYSGDEPSIRGVRTVSEACGGATVIVAIGGGSTIDAAKAAALSLVNDAPLEAYEGAERIPFDPVPIVAIPTTAGTGSEVTGSCVLESADGARKISIRSHKLVPRIAVLDAALLATTPPPVVAASGIDALAHAVEAYCSTRATPITDALALGALRLIGEHLVRYHHNRQDSEAAGAVALGACMAGMAFNSARVGLAHAIASAIGPLVHLPHGVCVGFGLPLALRLNAAFVGDDRFDVLLDAIGSVAVRDEPRGRCAESRVRELMADLDLPATVSATGRGFDVTQPLLHAVLQSGRLETNPAPMDENRLADVLLELRG